MKLKQLFTSIGRFEKRTGESGFSYPVIILNGTEYMADLQEMVIWTCLNWRIVRREEIDTLYAKMCKGNPPQTSRTLDECVKRLLVRGLLVSGTGETDYDALYDLLSALYIVPLNSQLPLRLLTFFKLVLLEGVASSDAKRLLVKDKRTPREERVMQLADQVLLSSAEIIKCVDKGITQLPTEESVLDNLYNDNDTTSENIGALVKSVPCSKAVTIAIANLYLRKQIIFERM